MSNDAILQILQDKTLDIKKVAAIYEENKNNLPIESMVAMNLSLRTSVYDKELEKSDTIIGLLEQLATSKSMEARWAVAKNPHTPIYVLETLAKDEINLVRALVATNANTPAKILEKFFNDEKIVRDGLSGNMNTPLKLLAILCKDTDKMVRLRVAENKASSKAILEQLSLDSVEDVKKAAQKNLANPITKEDS
jgi:hypothetical protein